MTLFILAIVLSFWPWVLFFTKKFEDPLVVGVFLFLQLMSGIVFFAIAHAFTSYIIPNCSWLVCNS